MADQRKGGIAWTEQSWNPIRGCSRVSAGCERCYAMGMAARFSGPGQPYEGLAVRKNGLAAWTGEMRFVPKHLEDPLRWKRPRRIFVNSMSDLFHENLSEKHIASIFAVMARAPRHVFQVLTKRSKIMRDLLNREGFRRVVEAHAAEIDERADAGEFGMHTGYLRNGGSDMGMRWPLPNVWLGVSAEDQRTADERLPDLLATPARVRWISAEPLIGPIDASEQWGRYRHVDGAVLDAPDWVVVGGESQPGCRPMDERWLRAIVEDCEEGEGTPVFVKQLGGHPNPRKVMAEFPADLQRQEYPG